MRVRFVTFGCRLNQAETAAFEREFAAAGWQVEDGAAPADVVVVHGCAVTRTAETEGLRCARRIKRAARASGAAEPFVVLVGCLVEADRSRTGLDGVDLLVPRSGKPRLAALVRAGLGKRSPDPSDRSDKSDSSDKSDTPSHPASRPCRARALLKVQDGCDFFCAYCLVPHLRGPPVSRPRQAVLDEAAALARAGAVELVLAGCNLAAYRDGPTGLAELAAAVAGCPGVARVRLGSVEPGRVEDALVDLMVADDRICRTLHLPVQSGDGGVLRAMGRRYTPERYAETVWRAAGRLSDLGVGTDVLVGFPGEDDAAFGRTMDLVRSLPFGNVHVFAFSPRPGTRAASMSAQVPAGARRERLRAMLALAAEKRREFAGRFVGRTVRVLIERVTAAGEGRGWSGSYVDCRVPGLSAASVGRIVDFTPRSAGKGTLL